MTSHSSETGSQSEESHPGHILAGGEDGSLSVFDLRSLSRFSSCFPCLSSSIDLLFFDYNFRPIERRKLHQEPLLAISSSSGHIVTGGASREIQLMTNIPPSSTNPSDKSTPYQQRTTLLINPGTLPPILHLHHSSLFLGTACCAVHQSGKIFLTGHWDGTVRLFTTKKMKPLAILSHHQSGVYSTDYSPTSTHGSIFATGSKDCTITIWSLYSNQLLPTTEAERGSETVDI
jgi:WD40 repeat protein